MFPVRTHQLRLRPALALLAGAVGSLALGCGEAEPLIEPARTDRADAARRAVGPETVRVEIAGEAFALELAIELMKPGRMWSEVATRIQGLVESEGLSVVRDFVGHGIGREMHEEPKVPNYCDTRQKRFDFELVPGMVLAIEPMVNLGSHKVEYADSNGWGVVTKDRKNAAHYEHSIAIVGEGADVLTDGR